MVRLRRRQGAVKSVGEVGGGQVCKIECAARGGGVGKNWRPLGRVCGRLDYDGLVWVVGDPSLKVLLARGERCQANHGAEGFAQVEPPAGRAFAGQSRNLVGPVQEAANDLLVGFRWVSGEH